MFSRLSKVALLAMAAMFVAILFVGFGVTSTSADAPQSAPPTVALPTPKVVRSTPTPAPKAAKSSSAARWASDSAWTSSVTYYTSSDTASSTGLTITYYAGTSTYTAGPLTLGAHTAGSLYIGNTTVPDNFAGSAVLSADVPIQATYVQFVRPEQADQNVGRMLYSAFSSTQAGSPFYIPTVLKKKFGSTTRIGVQNVGGSAITANLKFYAVGSTTATAEKNQEIQANASYVFSANDILGLPDGFNGSLVISATGGSFVAAAEETDDAGRSAYAFEGAASGANTIYMPSMMCNYNPEKQISYYAIQNTDLAATANVTINYYNTSGAAIGTDTDTIVPGGKWSANPCGKVPAGSIGSAQITSTGAKVIAIGKVKADNGMATAFVGQSAGGTKVVGPYVRWKGNGTDFSSYIAIMNVGGSPATNIVAKYYNGSGTLVATQTIASAASPLASLVKTSTNPQAAGALSSGDFGFSPAGGAVEITSDQPIAVVVRAQKDVTISGSTYRFSEDYNGTTVQ